MKIEQVKKFLKNRKQELEKELTQMSQEQLSDGQVQDQGDQALSATMDSLHNSIQNTELDEYNRVSRALEKIENGTYGICVDCGNDISPKRLQSFPDAQRCIVCQEVFEEGDE